MFFIFGFDVDIDVESPYHTVTVGRKGLSISSSSDFYD